MKPNFTPGPWKVKDGGWMCEGRSLYRVFPIYQRDGEMFQEDAFLCSAAPEMYEALNRIFENYSLLPEDYSNTESALKKARGEQ